MSESKTVRLWAVYGGKMHSIEAIKTAAQYQIKRAPLAFGCASRLPIDRSGRPREFGGIYCESRDEALAAYLTHICNQIDRHNDEAARLAEVYALDVPDAEPSE